MKLMESVEASGGQIGALEQQVLKIGQLAQTAISRAITAFVRRETMMARAVIREDEEIDRAEVEIHEQCLAILETERPQGSYRI